MLIKDNLQIKLNIKCTFNGYSYSYIVYIVSKFFSNITAMFLCSILSGNIKGDKWSLRSMKEHKCTFLRA